jgi:AcrR family transcriptional regulator
MKSVRERIIAAAREGLARGERPFVAEIIARAGVSKATFYRNFGSRDDLFRELDAGPEPDGRPAILYRLYPGKAALFAAMLREFSPIETLVSTLQQLADEPPERAMPALAVSIWGAVSTHLGVIRPLLFEAASLGPDVRETVIGEIAPKLLGSFGGYLIRQMQEGRLRPMHPVLAMQSFVGPIIAHAILRPVVNEALGADLDSEAAIREFAAIWVRGMQP